MRKSEEIHNERMLREQDIRVELDSLGTRDAYAAECISNKLESYIDAAEREIYAQRVELNTVIEETQDALNEYQGDAHNTLNS